MIMHQSKMSPAKSKPVARIAPVYCQSNHGRAVRLLVEWKFIGHNNIRNPKTTVQHCRTGKNLYHGRAIDAQKWCWENGFPIVEI